MQKIPSHLSFILLHGSISGNKQKNHTKYWAVITCKMWHIYIIQIKIFQILRGVCVCTIVLWKWLYDFYLIKHPLDYIIVRKNTVQLTLLNATNATVWTKKQKGKSCAKREINTSCTINWGRNEMSFSKTENSRS